MHEILGISESTDLGFVANGIRASSALAALTGYGNLSRRGRSPSRDHQHRAYEFRY